MCPLSPLYIKIGKIFPLSPENGGLGGIESPEALGDSGGEVPCTEPRLSHILERLASSVHAGWMDDITDGASLIMELRFGEAVQGMAGQGLGRWLSGESAFHARVRTKVRILRAHINARWVWWLACNSSFGG